MRYVVLYRPVSGTLADLERERPDLLHAHIAHLGELYRQGQVLLGGPFGGQGAAEAAPVGMAVFEAGGLEEVRDSLQRDPLWASDRATTEIYPWHTIFDALAAHKPLAEQTR
ncbi:MAG TPA: YciI family protein [Symbiobacteriaceae bacterium]|nr:YciI family protein [Symbiobacteriaceae bacterium]